MEGAPVFPEWSPVYATRARPLRDALSPDLRKAMDQIEWRLADDPLDASLRTVVLSDEMFIYDHPESRLQVTYKVDQQKKAVLILHLVAPIMPEFKPLFISYSHMDEEWLLELKKWLKPLEKKGLINIWDDTQLVAGDDWRTRINDALSAAKAAVLLVSQDFLASDFIEQYELPVLLEKAQEKGLKVLWIAVSESTVEDTQISKYQAVHKDPPLDSLPLPDRKREFKRIYSAIREAVEG